MDNIEVDNICDKKKNIFFTCPHFVNLPVVLKPEFPCQKTN